MMSSSPLGVSIIIPTHNRRAAVSRTVAALAHQTVPAGTFEVIVVADGGSDGTATALRSLGVSFPLMVVEQTATGAAAARNRGSALARGQLLLFLDDDMFAAPGMVAAHLDTHQRSPGGVVLGYFPMPAPERAGDAFYLAYKAWWDRRFADWACPGHRFSFQDFCSGNVSLSRELFDVAGKFDAMFPEASSEDYELGVRLMKLGVRFRFCSEAHAVHESELSQQKTLRRCRQDGYSQVLLAQKHPPVFGVLKLRQFSEFIAQPSAQRVWRLLWRHPRPSAVVASLLRGLLVAVTTMRWTSLMWPVYRLLDGYYFACGVRAAIGSLPAWERLQAAGLTPIAPHHELDIDVSTDLAELRRVLEDSHADAARLRFRDTLLGRIPPAAFAEPLRSAHVRQVLIANHATTLLGLMTFKRASDDDEALFWPAAAIPEIERSTSLLMLRPAHSLTPGKARSPSTSVTRKPSAHRSVVQRMDLLRELILRDIRIRYRRSLLGMAWTLINPLAQLVVLVFVFRVVLPVAIPNYATFLFIGMIAWGWFQTACYAASSAVTDNRALVLTPGFPAAILPIVTVVTQLVHFLMAALILLPFTGFGDVLPSPAWLLLPAVVGVQLLLLLGLGYFAAALHVRFRDTQYTIGVVLALGFYLTPILYEAHMVPPAYRGYYALNPLVHLIEAYRSILLHDRMPALTPLAAVALVSALVLWAGFAFFQTVRNRFIEDL